MMATDFMRKDFARARDHLATASRAEASEGGESIQQRVPQT
jgi:hypothetical protein